MKLSIVIPTLNSARCLRATLDPLRGADREILVVDGGSEDATAALAESLGARVLYALRGRASQMAAGAKAARGDWLLFLHADTRLDTSWRDMSAHFMSEPRNIERAAAFYFALDDGSAQARRLERAVLWRSRRLGLPYGDQGLLLSRTFYEALGGFRDLPIMEDVDLVRRIGRRRLELLAAAAVTSAARWQREGWIRRSARNLLCLSLYYCGLPPRIIAKLYD